MPQISDVTLLLGILQDLGAKVRYVNPHTVEIDSSSLRNGRVPYESARPPSTIYLVKELHLFVNISAVQVQFTQAGTLHTEKIGNQAAQRTPPSPLSPQP